MLSPKAVTRLFRLHAIVGSVARERFDMRFWFDVPSGSHAVDCKTAACAAGHACLDPVFQRAGLTHKKRHFSSPPVPVYEKALDGLESWGWDALEQFFEISSSEVQYIFQPSQYIGKDRGKNPDEGIVVDFRTDITPAHVQAHIENVFERNGLKQLADVLAVSRKGRQHNESV